MRQFKSLTAFGNHLQRLALVGHEVTHHIADEAGGEVERSAREKIGVYQAAAGPFSAWAPLADSTLARHSQAGLGDTPLYFSGQLRESFSHVTEGKTTTVGSTDPVMVYHEFGTSRMPPRPVLGPAMFESREQIIQGAAGIVAAWLAAGGWRRQRIRRIRK